ncbi:hypothetical protein D9758_002355 [Tetrapyrgos nigripes]|uniref:Uncharacterized protein n=1 Tax=Tetrapyrgos nigripes TaxID=182062 RepID=A0A8H5GNY6_9AGAR|nr:hypothetical protein D9758_002355 [Tetrapyrgos nigripes]
MEEGDIMEKGDIMEEGDVMEEGDYVCDREPSNSYMSSGSTAVPSMFSASTAVPTEKEEDFDFEEGYNVGATSVSSPLTPRTPLSNSSLSLAPSDSASQNGPFRFRRGSSSTTLSTESSAESTSSKRALSKLVRATESYLDYLSRIPCNNPEEEAEPAEPQAIQFTRGLGAVQVYLDEVVKPSIQALFKELPRDVQLEVQSAYPDADPDLALAHFDSEAVLQYVPSGVPQYTAAVTARNFQMYTEAREILALDSKDEKEDENDRMSILMMAQILTKYSEIRASPHWYSLNEEQVSTSFRQMADDVWTSYDGRYSTFKSNFLPSQTSPCVKTVIPSTARNALRLDSVDPTAYMEPDHLQTYKLEIDCANMTADQYNEAKRLVDLINFYGTKTPVECKPRTLIIRLIPFVQEFKQKNGNLLHAIYQLTQDLMIAASINTLLDLPFPSYGSAAAPQGCVFYSAKAEIVKTTPYNYLSFEVRPLKNLAQLSKVVNQDPIVNGNYDSGIANLENWLYYANFLYNQKAWFLDNVVATIKERNKADPHWPINKLRTRSFGLKPWL